MVHEQPCVELVYIAESGVQKHEEVKLHKPNMTVIEIIQQSMLPQQDPEGFAHIQAGTWGIGIFGVRCALDKTVQSGDRIECYRPLFLDPKEARRVRAKQSAIFAANS